MIKVLVKTQVVGQNSWLETYLAKDENAVKTCMQNLQKSRKGFSFSIVKTEKIDVTNAPVFIKKEAYVAPKKATKTSEVAVENK